jgi:hypothetical protein
MSLSQRPRSRVILALAGLTGTSHNLLMGVPAETGLVGLLSICSQQWLPCARAAGPRGVLGGT